jgi:tellurite resistance protein TerC
MATVQPAWWSCGGTPLLLALIVIEITDVIFAVDSIPAVLAVTTDPFVVYTSNVFALLGMRALYFLLAGATAKFRYLRPGLAIILAAVAAKLLLTDLYKFPVWVSPVFITAVLAVVAVLSIRDRRRQRPEQPAGQAGADHCDAAPLTLRSSGISSIEAPHRPHRSCTAGALAERG